MVRMIEVATGQERLPALKVVTSQNRALVDGSALFPAPAFSPDSKLLATGGAENTVKLWDIINRKEIVTLSGHATSVSAVAFSPDGKLLATASSDQTVKLWDIATKQELVTIRGFTGAIRS